MGSITWQSESDRTGDVTSALEIFWFMLEEVSMNCQSVKLIKEKLNATEEGRWTRD